MKLKIGHRYFDITEKDRVMFNCKVYIVITQKYFSEWNYANPLLATNKANKYIKRGVLVLCAEKYKGYEVDEEKLKEFLTPPKPKTVWDLKYGDRYYYISPNGNVWGNKWDDCTLDSGRRSIGNCFLTYEEAKFEVERRKVEAILLKYGGRRFKNSERNYYLYYDHEDNLIRKNMVNTCQSQGIIFFDDDKVIDQAIKEAGEDNIKKYIFGVDAE